MVILDFNLFDNAVFQDLNCDFAHLFWPLLLQKGSLVVICIESGYELYAAVFYLNLGILFLDLCSTLSLFNW